MSIADQPFPLDVSPFNEESQLVISMLSQFLGLDTDIFVSKLLLSLLYEMRMSNPDSQLLEQGPTATGKDAISKQESQR